MSIPLIVGNVKTECSRFEVNQHDQDDAEIRALLFEVETAQHVEDYLEIEEGACEDRRLSKSQEGNRDQIPKEGHSEIKSTEEVLTARAGFGFPRRGWSSIRHSSSFLLTPLPVNVLKPELDGNPHDE